MVEQPQPPINAPLHPSDPESETVFKVTPAMIESLEKTKPWALILAILGFICVLLMVLGGSINLIGFSQIQQQGPKGLFPFVGIGLANILMGLLYLFPSYFLLKYATSIGRLLDGGGQYSMEEALSYQKSFWKFTGIVGVIMIGIALLGIAAAIIIPMFFHFWR
jgi:hypothetical protein